MDDQVNNPDHYTQGGVECIDALGAFMGDNLKYFLIGNAVKYLWRCEHKGNFSQDIKKAKWYIDKLNEETL